MRLPSGETRGSSTPPPGPLPEAERGSRASSPPPLRPGEGAGGEGSGTLLQHEAAGLPAPLGLLPPDGARGGGQAAGSASDQRWRVRRTPFSVRGVRPLSKKGPGSTSSRAAPSTESTTSRPATNETFSM